MVIRGICMFVVRHFSRSILDRIQETVRTEPSIRGSSFRDGLRMVELAVPQWPAPRDELPESVGQIEIKGGVLDLPRTEKT